MIVLLASYPRSGNTFLRIALHHRYGVPTYTVHRSGDDLDVDVGAGHLTGYAPLPDPLPASRGQPGAVHLGEDFAALERSEEVYFLKSHQTWAGAGCPRYRVILVVRDGRDAAVSMAWYVATIAFTFRRLRGLARREFRWAPGSLRRFAAMAIATSKMEFLRAIGYTPRLFRRALTAAIADPTWSRLNAEWLDRPEGRTALVRYDDLVGRPEETLAAALESLDVRLPALERRQIPDFAALRQVQPEFFRQGRSGGWRQHFTAQDVETFWSVHGKVMHRLGFRRDD